MTSSGQSLVEFMLGSAVSAMMIGGTALLLHAQWNRFQCAHLVFEATHQRLISQDSITQIAANRPAFGLGGHSVHLTESSTSIRGEARCGRAHEQVELFKLEGE